MSEEEKKSFEELKKEINKPLEVPEDKCNTFILYNIDNAKIIVNLIKKQQKEIDLCEETEIALNNRIMDLEEINKEHQKLNGELRDEIKRQGNIREIEEKDIEKIIKYIKKEYENIDPYVRDLVDIQQNLLELLQGNLYQMYLYYKELASRYQADSVSKDKIREKIKEYKGLKEIDKMAYEEQIKPLQELLEEE